MSDLITDQQAQAIAYIWHTGNDSKLYSFASCGFIPQFYDAYIGEIDYVIYGCKHPNTFEIKQLKQWMNHKWANQIQVRRASYIKFTKELTNRQLLRDYRLSVQHLKDVQYRVGQDWSYYLGEPIRRVLMNAKHGVNDTKSELIIRGYDLDKIKL